MISTPTVPLPGTPTTGVLFSGGLDSSILVSHLLSEGQTVQPFYIRSGLRWESTELSVARKYLDAIRTETLRELVVLDVPVVDLYGTHWSLSDGTVPNARSADVEVHLPGRNALLVVKAAIWCKLHRVTCLSLAALGTSPFADAAPGFFDPLQTALNFGDGEPLQISRPFEQCDKHAVMTLGSRFPLELTFSCLAPNDSRHCGSCNKCAERQAAFQSIRSSDPTNYVQPPLAAVPQT